VTTVANVTKKAPLTRRVKRAAVRGAVRGAVAEVAPKPRPKAKSAPRRPTPPTAKPTPPTRPGARSTGWAALVAAAVAALGVYVHVLGPVGRGIDTGAGAVVGVGRVLLAPLLAAVGVFLIRGAGAEEEPQRAHELGGGALLVLAVTGLFDVFGSSPALGAPVKHLEKAGGYLGALTGTPLHAALANWGAVLVLLVVAGAGALLATRTGPARAATRVAHAAQVAWRAIRRGAAATADWITSFSDRPAPDGPGSELVDGERAGWFDDPTPRPARTKSPKTSGEPTPVEVTTGTPSQLEIDLGPIGDGGVWRLPPLSLLKRTKAAEIDRRPIEEGGRTLEAALLSHGVETRLIGTTVGPTVARYELELGSGVKVAKVTSLSKDIAYAMAAEDVRILAPIPGKSAIGVEVPNRQRQLVGLGDILTGEDARRATHPLEVAVGRDINGRGVMANMAEMPHILIAGATGAGKSSCINSIITSVLVRATPEQVRLILVDPKRVELGQYEGVPHLLTQVVTNPKRAANALAWVVAEMEHRYDLLHEVGVRDITGYNAAFDRGELVADDKEYHRLPFIMVVVDELNDLMMVAARDVEESICRIAQMARAVGIHLVIATQRPSVDVITGVIKANIPSRLAFKVSSLADSRVILDQQGAEKLVGKGDMLLLTANTSVSRRIQGCWVSEEEVRKVVAHWRRQAEPVYVEGVEGASSEDGEPVLSSAMAAADDDDDLLAEAMELVVRSQLGSTSMLQRKLRVGFARAGRLMDLLERRGVVGPSEGSKARAVLMTVDELESSSRIR
jgi:S-DNA-T family DNA segregation ATPase FtsK/SpoIIIE